MLRYLPTLLLAAFLWLFASSVYAAGGCETYITRDPSTTNYTRYCGGSVTSCHMGRSDRPMPSACEYPNDVWYSSETCVSPKTFDAATGYCVCPVGKIEQNGTCIDPPLTCQHPKIDDGSGGCKCPDGQIEEGETCKPKPDCSKKQTECSTECGGVAGSMSGVAYFYCEAANASDPSTQLFHEPSYNCECIQKGACSNAQVYGTDGTLSCADPKSPGCPEGSFYGEFNGQKGCIKPPSHNDPDETPKNCISGTNAVYHGSTLYCVPPPDSPPSSGCPTGTTAKLAGTLKICERIDNGGNSTGDSPDTNGYIKGTPTSGSGTGTGDGSGTGTGTSTDSAATAAKLAEIKTNTDAIKASGSFTAANTQATANNTADIKKNTDDINKSLTGTAPNTTKGSFTDGIAAMTAETDQVKADLSTKLDQIKSSITQKFSTSSSVSGAGSLPCFEQLTFLGQNIQFCFTQFNEEFSIIGQFIVGLGFLLAAFIILRKD